MSNSDSSDSGHIQQVLNISPRGMPVGKQEQIKEQLMLESEDPIVEYETPTQQNEQFIQQDNNDLKMSLIPYNNPIKLEQYSTTLPVVLKITVAKPIEKAKRAPIDLVCVVDVSGSMSTDNKLKMVMDSLRYLMKILSTEDRISIVIFDNRSRVILPWTRNTPENKQKIKSTILGMETGGSTNIASGVEKGLRLIKSRKYKNPVTCMFLLSDGQDDNAGADLRVQKALVEYQIQDSFVINCFGYGKDHDAKLMDSIAQCKQGIFSFIDDVEKASVHFILAMSGMLSIYAQNTTIQLNSIQPFQIKKVYGDGSLWFKTQQGYEATINYLLAGQDKEFILELEIPPVSDNINDNVQCMVASLTAKSIKDHQQINSETALNLNIDANLVQIVINQYVDQNYLRAKAGETIGLARELAGQRKYDDAIQLLNKTIAQVEASPYVASEALSIVLLDLQNSKVACTPHVFEQGGDAQMRNKQRNHLQRQFSVQHSQDWDSNQEDAMSNYKKGNLALSCSSGSPRQNKKVRKSIGTHSSGSNRRSLSPQYQQVIASPRRQNSIPRQGRPLRKRSDSMGSGGSVGSI